MPSWLRLIWMIAIINFISFWIIAVVSGGDAVSGKKENGRYYLRNHGRYTEVSAGFFTYSRIHTRSTWIGYGIGGLGTVFWLITRRKKPAP